MIDLQELRRLAECASANPELTVVQDNFMDAINPSDIINLLDRLSAAEKVCRVAEEYCDYEDNVPLEVYGGLTQALAEWKEAQ